eukprot:gene1060-biopygen6728
MRTARRLRRSVRRDSLRCRGVAGGSQLLEITTVSRRKLEPELNFSRCGGCGAPVAPTVPQEPAGARFEDAVERLPATHRALLITGADPACVPASIVLQQAAGGVAGRRRAYFIPTCHNTKVRGILPINATSPALQAQPARAARAAVALCRTDRVHVVCGVLSAAQCSTLRGVMDARRPSVRPDTIDDAPEFQATVTLSELGGAVGAAA